MNRELYLMKKPGNPYRVHSPLGQATPASTGVRALNPPREPASRPRAIRPIAGAS